jgi:gamma-glutamyl phosphate reductase
VLSGKHLLCRGERAMSLGLAGEPAESMSTEYGDLRMSFEVVSGLQEAVDHIHQYGR